MALLNASHLRRYRDIAGLLWRHRPGDLEKASDEKAQRLADDLEALGPTFVKLGQVLSTRPDLMPVAYLKALSRLQDKVAPFDARAAQEIIATELNVRVSKAFSEFSEKPLAAASIGQVHRASLRDGRQVVVKVQRPNIRETIEKDLDVFEEISVFLEGHSTVAQKMNLTETVKEGRRTILTELKEAPTIEAE